jgi:hypothetical protein
MVPSLLWLLSSGLMAFLGAAALELTLRRRGRPARRSRTPGVLRRGNGVPSAPSGGSRHRSHATAPTDVVTAEQIIVPSIGADRATVLMPDEGERSGRWTATPRAPRQATTHQATTHQAYFARTPSWDPLRRTRPLTDLAVCPPDLVPAPRAAPPSVLSTTHERQTTDLLPVRAALPRANVVELSSKVSGDRHLTCEMTVRLVERVGVYHASVAGRPKAWLGLLPLFPSSLPVTSAASLLVIDDGVRIEKIDLGDHVPLAPVANGLLEVSGGAGLPRDGGGVFRNGTFLLDATSSSTYVAVAVEIGALIDDPGALERAAKELNDRLTGLDAVTTPLDHGRSAARAAEIFARTELRGAASSVVVQAHEDGWLQVAWIGDISISFGGRSISARPDLDIEQGCDEGVRWLVAPYGCGPVVVGPRGFDDLAATVNVPAVLRP